MKLKKKNNQASQQNESPTEIPKNEIVENNQEVKDDQDEQTKSDEPIIGFHPTVVKSLYSSWKESELEYAKNMINLFKSVRKQNDNITSGLEEIKSNFRDFLAKSDNKQEKLDHFIESFNKFTEEFPELRPDEQTKEELNNRWDLLNEEFWDIIEANKEAAIAERSRIINSGWIEHELQQLTIKAQQFIGSEVKRWINWLNFIHKFYMSKKGEKTLEEYRNKFPQKYSLSLFDESSDHGEQINLPKVEDINDPN